MTNLTRDVQLLLEEYMSAIMVRSVLSLSVSAAKVDLSRLRTGERERLLQELTRGVRIYVPNPEQQQECLKRLAHVLKVPRLRAEEAPVRIRIPIEVEADIVQARATGRDLARSMGFNAGSQIKVATAVSEVARNIIQYAGTGKITIRRLTNLRPGIEVVATDEGPGISDLELVMSDRYRSKTGMGIGLKGARNLMDEFELESFPGKGTRVVLKKYAV